MLHSKLFACLAVGLFSTVAIGAPLGAAAAKKWEGGPVAHSPLGRLVSGQIGRLMVLRSELNLTDEQRARVKETLKAHKPEIAAAGKAVWEKRVALRDLVLDEKADEPAIRKAADDLARSIGDAAVLAAKIRGEVAPVLTDEQKKLIRQTRLECREATEKFFAQALEAK